MLPSFAKINCGLASYRMPKKLELSKRSLRRHSAHQNPRPSLPQNRALPKRQRLQPLLLPLLVACFRQLQLPLRLQRRQRRRDTLLTLRVSHKEGRENSVSRRGGKQKINDLRNNHRRGRRRIRTLHHQPLANDPGWTVEKLDLTSLSKFLPPPDRLDRRQIPILCFSI